MFHVLWGLPLKVEKIEKFLPNFNFYQTKEVRSFFDFLS